MAMSARCGPLIYMTSSIASVSNYTQNPTLPNTPRFYRACIDCPKLHKTLQPLPSLPQPSLHHVAM
ncbi:hypothetical protein L873DRAFT_1434249 [Choiromyces venosus 120613-1]|uniref:Uncharacterized protein n=1 Tax=Choiromyces venosus 120613-1 TaxID=1336337 RepID=A0A3N4JKL8_9PEZI|nr:hypothetical protein L873DRAFT_1434249 [Choiromyces venosus 120613-1]